MTDAEWKAEAAKLLKAELVRAGIGYQELCRRLGEIGVEEGYKGLANKINRGAFSLAFFMQCMRAIGVKGVRLEP